ncbi:MAG: AAA family ATPase [Marinobacterium sp.]|nr:AAA family ATPase [Marinobacterium sp.]
MTLPESLQNPDLYPHPVTELRVIETHISWLILTGQWAYKLKKPVNFGFLDFTTLENRRHFCEEEVRLNRRLAPDIYQQVVTLYGSEEAPSFAAQSPESDHSTTIEKAAPILEYAVKMMQFDDSQRLDRLLTSGHFKSEWIDQLAEQIADFHARVPIVASDSPWGEPDTVWQVVSDNFLHIGNALENTDDWQTLQQISNQVAQQFRSLQDLLIRRKALGFVRECHGDLHLANITLHNNELRLFDCIEFNLQFRWIDTICDLAFLLMDLEANGQWCWAARCLNHYLELSGDYEGVRMLRFYKSYRAMVRAKVATLGPVDLPAFRHYVTLASHYNDASTPALLLMQGVSGSGKSHLSTRLCEATGAIRVRADVERKRLHRELSKQGQPLELYGREMNTHTYNRLLELSNNLLRAGYSVVVDATFIRRHARQGYQQLAQKLALPIRIISCQCQPAELERRLLARAEQGQDISDATVDIMHSQLQHLEPLNEAEQRWSLAVDTQQPDHLQHLLSNLSQQGILKALNESQATHN